MNNQRLILIVDDNEVNRAILRNILEPDYAVDEAPDGRQALALLSEMYEQISAVLLDLQMPEMDGYEVLRAMRADKNLAGIPVIVTTATEGQAVEIRALQMGAADFVTKPYHPQIIRQRLTNLVQLRESAALVNSVERDFLTGLYNRDAFYRRLRQRFSLDQTAPYILVALDIDRFRLINDLFGVAEGDRLLKHVASLLQGFMIYAQGMSSRISGGHFVFLVTSEETVQSVVTGMIAQLREYPLGMQVAARFGVYRVTDFEVEVSTMCDRAILAAETIKGKYESYLAYYDNAIRDRLLQEQEIENDMRAALACGQFVVYYQPKVDLATEKIVGAEALVRWQHPQKGLLSPDTFIPLFERNGFITELDLYVWDCACRDMAQLASSGLAAVPVSVNLSRIDVYNAHLAQELMRILKKYDLPPQMLHLEITETAYTQNPEQLISVVEQLKSLGFSIEMDDFGSGYSSLNMLSELPIDTLKLDMRFLQSKMAEKRNDILSFVIALARWLGLVVIAEGVETAQQAQFLRSLNCNLAQGYYYARPADVQALRKLLENNQASAEMLPGPAYDGVVELSELWNPTSAFNHIFGSFIGVLTLYEFDGAALNFIRANERFYKIDGNSHAHFAGDNRDVLPRIYEADRPHLLQQLAHAWKENGEFTADVRWHSGSADDLRWLHVQFKLLNRSDARAIFLCSQEDVTGSKMMQAQLLNAARRDAMTGLLNRITFENAVERELKDNPDASDAFIVLDLDNFKQINDDGGHLHGDDVLRQVAKLLQETVRGDDMMARLGGDEFAVFMRRIPSARVATERTQLLCEGVRAAVSDRGISASAGIALYPTHGATFSALYDRAAAALNAAKKSGKNQCVIACNMPDREEGMDNDI